MKVIFIKDLKGVGYKNDIKDQPDGYARNFLLPKGFAVPATAEAVKKVERAQNEIRVEKEVQSDLFKRNLEAINGAGITIKVKTNEKGHLFKAIHAKDIADALKKDLRIIISEEYIKVVEPIKETGTFAIGVEALGMKESITVHIVKG
jgi:large subunit ribosomal protein L9